MNQPIPQPLDGIKRVTSLKLLGVTLQDNLSMNEHVNFLLLDCSHMLYALNTLRAHGMNNEGLQDVLRAKIVSKLTYASPVWSGFASQLDINKIDIPQQSQETEFLPHWRPYNYKTLE